MRRDQICQSAKVRGDDVILTKGAFIVSIRLAADKDKHHESFSNYNELKGAKVVKVPVKTVRDQIAGILASGIQLEFLH